ncbi:peptidase M16 [Clostridium botulinum C]|uniref:insulinase family protein n=1 Tax=Clostridium botulinum TaxID=1491 RepID=UPI001E44BE85|nr:insulinase family protein [Clostridium botulinum]MCD3246277.1 peptidase M16 [Clostridium botulinum C]MCD3262641.1 peptidase M16 [Clostridium botulinum C]
MNRRLKAKIVLALVSIMTCQTLALQKPVLVSAVESNSKLVSSVKENKSLGGFELVTKKYIKALNCNSYEYKHTKTGAKLIFLDNKNEDKMICVNFRTPTKDSTGVNHIIEHSVLQGSKNYPVKDPFIQMSKQSLNTFLNAMTAADMTMYPVSSKNDKDFNNLMSIYLDAVFHPNMINDERIFKEEGWRYELESKDSELKYNGIVYNEMKGVYSDPSRVLVNAISKSLFPDTIYKNESGGSPDKIPDLSYKEFVDTYKKYYTPSNSYFYLSGNLNIEKTLKFIGEKYLNNFEKVEVHSSIPVQKSFNERKVSVAEYSVPKDASTKNKTYLSSNYVIDKSPNKDITMKFSLLNMLLTGTPAAPICKAMQENGLGENIKSQFNPNYAQSTFSIIASNVNENQKEKFQQVIDKTLKDIVKDGFDKKLLDSLVNQFKLSKRMGNGNNPLMYNMLIMTSWLYDGDPTLYLDMDMNNIEKIIKDGELEKMVQKYLLDNKHSSLVVLNPSKGLQERREAQLKEKLASIKKSLSKDEINELVKETKELKEWQGTPNTKEQLEKLPTLTRDDIDKKAREYKTIEKNEDGIKILQHPIFTNGVNYISLYFDTSKVPQEKLGYIGLLESTLAKVDTKNYTKEQLLNYIMANSGGIQVVNTAFEDAKDSNNYFPKTKVSMVSLNNKLDKNFEILKEMIFNSKLNDKKRLKEIINNTKMNLEGQLMTSGAQRANEKILSYISEAGKYNNYQSEGFYKFICDLDKDFNSKSDEIVRNLENIRDIIFNKQYMIASYTGEEKDYNNFVDNFKKFSKELKNENLKSHKYKFDDSKVNEGIITPSKVQYVVKGGNIKNAGYKDSGKLQVLANVLTSGYLWNDIRIKGGAYGTDVSSENGNLIFSSYRDPNLKETINTFDKVPEYLCKFNADEREMTNYIIGTIGKLDSAMNQLNSMLGPIAEGILGDNMYITGITQSDIQKQREEILSTTAEDIRNFAKVVDAVLKQDYLCVVGGDAKIKENEKEFMSIKNVLDMDNKKDLTMTMEKKENVPVDKSFKVNFSKELDELTVNTSNVYVLDDKNHKVDVEVSYDKKNKAVQVKSKNNYESGKKYTLFIKGIQSVIKDGKVVKLVAPIKMEFTVK